MRSYDNSLVGTWKLKSFVRETVATGERHNQFGEYRAVVAGCVWPSNLPIIGRLIPAPTATLAKLWRRS
jgi:hypothetical protein